MIKLPKVVTYSLEEPPQCVLGSTRYLPPKATRVQLIQKPKSAPLKIINCRVTVQFLVGWCGTNSLVNEINSPLAMQKRIVFPTSLQCGHAAETGVLKFHIPQFGTSPRKIVRAELVQGVKMGEKFTLGWSDARSDCRSKRWTGPVVN